MSLDEFIEELKELQSQGQGNHIRQWFQKKKESHICL